MTLIPLQDSAGQWHVRGVTSDPSVAAPLGKRYFNVGAHWIGFDDSFAEPVIVRSYYDPTSDPVASRSQHNRQVGYIGYMQFMQLSFRGMPIPPTVYGGRLADRQPYAYGDDFRFIDFMGPAQASLRNIKSPFYPFNALLVDGGPRQVSDFFVHPMANGSLVSPTPGGPTQSRVASLAGEIAPGLITPEDIRPYLTKDALLVTYRPTPPQLANSEAYRIALNELKTASFKGGDPLLAGLVESGLVGQVIGEYVLLTPPDPEDLGHTLCVSTRSVPLGNTEIDVHLLSSYDLASMLADAGRAALWRIRKFEIDTQAVSGDMMEGVRPTGRGRRGLLSPPYLLDPREFVLELKYWTLAVAFRDRASRSTPRRQFLTGITWSALFQFDDDTGLLSFAAIREPAAVTSYKLNLGLLAYESARTSPNAVKQFIDTSNFTKAAMRRDNFAGGPKLRFVDAFGADLSP